MWSTEEAPGVDVEYYRVLAAREAYAAEAGYSAKRTMSVMVHSKQEGEVARYSVGPAILDA